MSALQKSIGAPVVVVRDLVKQFGRFAALRGISENFAAGKLYVILGDNGAGKTTLLRTLAGLAHPTRGTVSLFETEDMRTVARRIGYMAHPSLLYDELSGVENLQYFARLYGIEDDHCSEDAIRKVHLDPTLRRPVGQYSQGMRQRLSLARAIVHDPEVLILDEPFSNVDVHSANQMASLLGGMRDEGKTLFLVTHQAALMETVADEFIYMEAGKILRRAPPLQRLEAASQ